MPYSARKHQLQNALVYHAYNRSNARVEIFHCDKDYRYFIQLLIAYSREFNAKIYHWVIMPNHYHLLLELAEPAETKGQYFPYLIYVSTHPSRRKEVI